jgi:hypothetical protein
MKELRQSTKFERYFSRVQGNRRAQSTSALLDGIIRDSKDKIKKNAQNYLKFLLCISKLSLTLNALNPEFLAFGLI